jgi:hypothetical protein
MPQKPPGIPPSASRPSLSLLSSIRGTSQIFDLLDASAGRVGDERTYPTSCFIDLIELNGDDLRREPLEVRKATLASIAAKARPGNSVNEHIEGDGPTAFAQGCKLGLEGIVSKRKGFRLPLAPRPIGWRGAMRIGGW